MAHGTSARPSPIATDPPWDRDGSLGPKPPRAPPTSPAEDDGMGDSAVDLADSESEVDAAELGGPRAATPLSVRQLTPELVSPARSDGAARAGSLAPLRAPGAHPPPVRAASRPELQPGFRAPVPGLQLAAAAGMAAAVGVIALSALAAASLVAGAGLPVQLLAMAASLAVPVLTPAPTRRRQSASTRAGLAVLRACCFGAAAGLGAPGYAIGGLKGAACAALALCVVAVGPAWATAVRRAPGAPLGPGLISAAGDLWAFALVGGVAVVAGARCGVWPSLMPALAGVGAGLATLQLAAAARSLASDLVEQEMVAAHHAHGRGAAPATPALIHAGLGFERGTEPAAMVLACLGTVASGPHREAAIRLQRVVTSAGLWTASKVGF